MRTHPGPLAVSLLALAAYTTFSTVQWRRLETPSWDLGIFTQLARRYAALEAPVVNVKGDGYNLLGDHFHPLLVLLGVPYRIAPSALTVMVVQDVLLAFSVWVIAREAARRLGAVQGTAVGFAYAASFGLVGAVAVQFHEIAFAVPLLAVSLVALLRERWLAAVLWAAPLVFVKEDLGSNVVALGLVLWWRARSSSRAVSVADERHDEHRRGERLGLGLAAWGAVWLVLAQKVILPAFNPDGEFAYADRLDVGALLRQPWLLVGHLVDDQRKLATLAVLILATGLVGLRSPVLLVAVPTLLWRFWSGNYGFWGYTWHYSAILMPVAFAALLDGVDLAAASPRRWLRGLGTSAVAICVTAAVVMLPRLPLGRFGDPSFWEPNPRADAAHRILDAVPDGVSVETDVGLMSYLVDTRDVFWFGNDGNPAPDYLVFDTAWGGTPGTRPALLDWAAEHHPDASYQVVAADGGYLLARRTDGRPQDERPHDGP